MTSSQRRHHLQNKHNSQSREHTSSRSTSSTVPDTGNTLPNGENNLRSPSIHEIATSGRIENASSPAGSRQSSGINTLSGLPFTSREYQNRVENDALFRKMLTSEADQAYLKRISQVNWTITLNDVAVFPGGALLQGELNELGKGNFGDVYSASFAGSKIAVKTTKDTDEIRAEHDAMSRMYPRSEYSFIKQHPNIVHFSHLHIFKGKNGRDEQGLVLEALTGTLEELLAADLSPEQQSLLLVDILSAIAFLEGTAAGDEHLVHNDMKSDNFMLSEGGVLKLIDFGGLKGKDEKQGNYNMQAANVAATHDTTFDRGFAISVIDKLPDEFPEKQTFVEMLKNNDKKINLDEVKQQLNITVNNETKIRAELVNQLKEGKKAKRDALQKQPSLTTEQFDRNRLFFGENAGPGEGIMQDVESF